MTNSYPTGCNYSEGHGPCGGASNGLYCQNHQDCRRGCDCSRATRLTEAEEIDYAARGHVIPEIRATRYSEEG